MIGELVRLQKRVKELEAENQKLKEKNAILNEENLNLYRLQPDKQPA